jgi:hypothetical protein
MSPPVLPSVVCSTLSGCVPLLCLSHPCHFTFLISSVLICDMGFLVAPTSQGCVKSKVRETVIVL